MKIAFIGGRDIHKLGGIENYMYNLATELAKAGHEPIIYCESDINATEEVDGFKVVYQKSVGGRLCKIILGLKSTINAIWDEQGVEYIHYNAWPPSLWSWVARAAHRKTVFQSHGLEWKRTKYTALQRKIMHFMEWLSVKLNDNITVVSDEQREYFKSAYGAESVTIPTAVHMPSPDIDSDILDRLQLEDNGYFLFLGRLVQDKNPDCLIEAFKMSGTGKKLVIAGSNDQAPEYVEHLRRLAAGNNDIIFTGAVYGADKEALLAHCFAFCIPSTIEGLAITLLEAMSYGRICIASDIAANREGLGEDAIWVEPENIDDLARKLYEVVNDYEIFEHMGENNRKRIAEQFTWDMITKKYLNFIDNAK